MISKKHIQIIKQKASLRAPLFMTLLCTVLPDGRSLLLDRCSLLSVSCSLLFVTVPVNSLLPLDSFSLLPGAA